QVGLRCRAFEIELLVDARTLEPALEVAFGAGHGHHERLKAETSDSPSNHDDGFGRPLQHRAGPSAPATDVRLTWVAEVPARDPGTVFPALLRELDQPTLK
ncbi:hypothetical protein HK405_009855, partial [Cladochytrium tenue]